MDKNVISIVVILLLLSAIFHLLARLEECSGKIEMLQIKYYNEVSDLQEKYNRLIVKYNRLADEYEMLLDNYTELNAQCNKLINEYENQNNIPEWEQLLIEFANTHSYDWYDYNCVDYSRDAVEMLREHGYDARQVQGHCKGDPPNINHAWVELCLWYEPQTGELIKKDKCSINM